MHETRRRRALVLAAIAIALAAPANAQQTPSPDPGATLTALDYLEIEQLVYRYGYALDTGAENGYAYADLYAPDATFTGTNQGPRGRTYRGRDELAALARGGRRGPLFVSHYVANVVIEPSADGAVGRTYVGILDIGNGGNGASSRVDHGGLYNDVYVRTPAGWRFKSRTFYSSTSGAPVQPPPAVVGVPRALSMEPARSTAAPGAGRLAAEDYIAIQQLVARYPYALDQNPDNGASYAALFTPDAVFRQPRTEGRENLARLANTQPHGPRYTRHFLANHVIEPTSDGAIGKQYLVVVDIGEAGQPSTIFLGGHYEDVYAKTADGWRFRTRTFISSRTGDAPAQGAASAPPAGNAALTPQDRAEIQELTARYARALGACEAEDYAGLFAPESGYFASNIRGEVAGRERLMAMVRSERHCNPSGGTAAANAGAAARPVPTVSIEASPSGATGRADLGNAGGYEDEYVKTPRGWRFKSRTVVTPQERAAGLSARDMAAIRRLAGSDLGLFDDVYVIGADGIRRFRSSGVPLTVVPEGVSGRAVLKGDGGRYDDVYVRAAGGGWRFKSRVYVPADQAAETPRAASPSATPR
jgi:hypothetical protein